MRFPGARRRAEDDVALPPARRRAHRVAGGGAADATGAASGGGSTGADTGVTAARSGAPGGGALRPAARTAGVLALALSLVLVDGGRAALAPTDRAGATAVDGLAVSAAPAVVTTHAEQWAATREEEAAAIAHAALAAARAVATVPDEVVAPDVRSDLAVAAAELEQMVDGTGPTLRPGRPVGVMVPDTHAGLAAAPLRAAARLERTEEVDAAATRLFRVSLEVEAAVEAAAAEATGPDLVVDDLEAVVLEAERAAAVFRAGQEPGAPRERSTGEHPTGWRNGELPLDELCGVPFSPDDLLRCDASDALGDLNEAYRAEHGADLVVVSAYRSLGEQASVRLTRGALAAAPGRSNHGWGIAVDLGGLGGLGVFDDPDYLWLTANAGRFGWVHPRIMEPGGGGPQEPWHWEFVGSGAGPDDDASRVPSTPAPVDGSER